MGAPTEDAALDLEDLGRREQLAAELWTDGFELEAIVHATKLHSREIRQALVSRQLMTWEGDDLPLAVGDVSAGDVGRTYLFDAEVLSVEGGMTLPTRIRATCLACEGEAEAAVPWGDLLTLTPAEKERQVEGVAYVAHQVAPKGCKKSKSSTTVRWEELQGVDYAVLTVGDVREGVRFGQVRDDTRLEAHLVGPRPPLGGRVRLRAQVVVHPRTRRLMLLAEEYRELEGRPAAPAMDAATREAFARIGGLDVDTLRNQVAPDMVGRPLAQEALLLTQVSVARIPDVAGDKEIRGALNTAEVGDTTTNKTEAAKDVAQALGLGAYVQAENAKRTGLTYSISESPSGGWKLTWGLLPRYHGTLAVLDGLERWKSEVVGELRAVLREGHVRVEKVVHGERPALLRYILTLNPKRAMAEYAFRCMAIRDSWVFEHGPDVARVDLWIPFAEEDVEERAIAYREAAERPVDVDTWRSFVYWAWSLGPEDVAYVEGAKARIQRAATGLMTEYGTSSVPVAHRGLRDTVSRVAVAYAVLGFSTTDDGRSLVVQEVHVQEAEAFLRRMYDALELREYRDHHDQGALLTPLEFLETVDQVGVPGTEIVSHLARRPDGWTTAKELVELMKGGSVDWVRRQYDNLTDRGLVETRSGAGARLTPKGVVFFRQLRSLNLLFSQKTARSQDVLTENRENNRSAEGLQS